ncbi:MAG TPA: hypothetical protein VH855_27700 [Acetobacteraceae bacterium]
MPRAIPVGYFPFGRRSDDDGADRPAAHLGGDFLQRGLRAVRCPVAAARRIGAGVKSWPRAARPRSLSSKAAARRGPLAMRARMIARSVVPKRLANWAKFGPRRAG